MFEQVLLIAGAAIFGILGIVHLIYTFFSNKFNALDHNVTHAMKQTSPLLTQETSMWNAWVGFNASHSLGAILIAAFYVPLAINDMELIRENLWFSILPVVIGLSYLALAKKYWFKKPFISILIATICFIGVAVLTNT